MLFVLTTFNTQVIFLVICLFQSYTYTQEFFIPGFALFELLFDRKYYSSYSKIVELLKKKMLMLKMIVCHFLIIVKSQHVYYVCWKEIVRFSFLQISKSTRWENECVFLGNMHGLCILPFLVVLRPPKCCLSCHSSFRMNGSSWPAWHAVRDDACSQVYAFDFFLYRILQIRVLANYKTLK